MIKDKDVVCVTQQDVFVLVPHLVSIAPGMLGVVDDAGKTDELVYVRLFQYPQELVLLPADKLEVVRGEV